MEVWLIKRKKWDFFVAGRDGLEEKGVRFQFYNSQDSVFAVSSFAKYSVEIIS